MSCVSALLLSSKNSKKWLNILHIIKKIKRTWQPVNNTNWTMPSYFSACRKLNGTEKFPQTTVSSSTTKNTEVSHISQLSSTSRHNNRAEVSLGHTVYRGPQQWACWSRSWGSNVPHMDSWGLTCQNCLQILCINNKLYKYVTVTHITWCITDLVKGYKAALYLILRRIHLLQPKQHSLSLSLSVCVCVCVFSRKPADISCVFYSYQLKWSLYFFGLFYFVFFFLCPLTGLDFAGAQPFLRLA